MRLAIIAIWDIFIMSAFIYLIGWQGWSAWWMILAVLLLK
mgnify:CR=1 FL=1